MNIQYISDNKGITTGVYIPIQEWEKLKESCNIPEDIFEISTLNRKELDSRIDQYVKNPNDLLDWKDVEKKLLNRK